jgi:[ribosomal protein S18]-alanine N-acetyltransferase
MPDLSDGPERYFIRRMKVGDLPAVREIERQSFSNPWSDNTFRGEIQNTAISFPMVAVRRPGEEVVGYIVFWLIREDAQVNNIAVQPGCRGLGLGEAMMRYAIARSLEAGATRITLEVRQSNAPALTLYRKLGFEILGTRKNYYTKPDEDAYVMALVLA